MIPVFRPIEPLPPVAPCTRYDYEHQAWVRGGRYVRCGHPDSMRCSCYGKLHEGEKATDRDNVRDELEGLSNG